MTAAKDAAGKKKAADGLAAVNKSLDEAAKFVKGMNTQKAAIESELTQWKAQ